MQHQSVPSLLHSAKEKTVTKLTTKQLAQSLDRVTQFPANSLFVNRWSPRQFDQNPVEVQDLMTMFEAARWTPSAYNLQPWRFVYSLRNDTYWNRFIECLDPFNQKWASHAGAVVFLLSKTVYQSNGADKFAPTHSFDSGAAWMQFTLQANLLGYHTRGIGGVDKVAVRNLVGASEKYVVQIAIAIGKTDQSVLTQSAPLAESSRRTSVSEFTFAGHMNEEKIHD